MFEKIIFPIVFKKSRHFSEKLKCRAPGKPPTWFPDENFVQLKWLQFTFLRLADPKTCGTQFWQAKSRWGVKHSPLIGIFGIHDCMSLKINLDNAGPCRNAIVTILHSYEISTPNTYTLATNSLANYDLICAARYVNETHLRGTKEWFQQTMKRENEISNNTYLASQGRKTNLTT